MLYCEQCRIKKSWPRLPGYPQIGWTSGAVCEVCRSHTDCHDVPGSRLKPLETKTTEEKLVDTAMENGYHNKADGLAIWTLDGKINTVLTELLKKTFVGPEHDPDWYCTYLLRLKLQRDIRLSEEQHRDKTRR